MESDLAVLASNGEDPRNVPTWANKTHAMRWLTLGTQPNDSYIFHFSGHGSQTKGTTGSDIDGLPFVCDHNDRLVSNLVPELATLSTTAPKGRMPGVVMFSGTYNTAADNAGTMYHALVSVLYGDHRQIYSQVLTNVRHNVTADEAFFAHLTLARLVSAGMKPPLTTVATLVAVLIAHEGSLVAAGPTSTDTATTPNDGSASAFVEQERGVASDAFPVYCPKILTSSFLKKGQAALDYTRLWKKKLNPKDGTVEKVADWLSVRFAYARMGHNYTDPTIVSGPPSFTIWVPPVAGLVPIANPVANYQATGIDQLAFIDGVAKHYKKKPVYININHRLLGQPAGQAVVSVLDTCFGGAISGIPRSNGGALGTSDYPTTSQYSIPPQGNSGHNNAAPYGAQPQNSGYPTTSQYGPPPQGGSGHNNAAPYGAQPQNSGYPTTSQYAIPPQGGSGHNNAAQFNSRPQNSQSYGQPAGVTDLQWTSFLASM
ncbi:Ca(2+)-dependent cysteine protease [Tieghemiomyces parasiticus]|uniref:Ca(2+)-dependent cysteine protease n=1 Tax=Tieghemiomyces parasiticus TaxID=78921 RepID=A0A9W7ZY83_9FUNG|nr:Ca(2+)-dependent cysteine protease [Tieghemiomyces parasiticus]